MAYGMDLSGLSLREYGERLKAQNLLPGRRALWQDIDKNFAALEVQGIADLAELRKRLSTPSKLAALAKATGVGGEYLVLLRREIGSLEQKPVPLADFPGVDGALLAELRARGIRTSKDYFESERFGADELSSLCDLVRINGVGAVAARAVYEAGYRSVGDVARADAGVMLERVSRVNGERKYFKAKLAEKDMRFCIDFARMLNERGN